MPSLPPPVPFLDLGELYRRHQREFEQAIGSVFDSGIFIGGTAVKSFETAFARWLGGHGTVVGCGNGTDALFLAAAALDLPRGSKALLPAMTYVATAEGMLDAGLDFDLVDVDAETWLLSPEKTAAALSPEIKVVVPVHLYGQMAPMDQLRQVAGDRFLIEDASQAHGARWKDRPVGHWGDIATYSFFPGKNLGAFGDAGGVFTRNPDWAKAMRAIANHGGLQKYQHDRIGRNSRLDAIQAALLEVKLRYIDEWNAVRRQLADRYRHRLQGIPGLRLPKTAPEATPVYHLFVVMVEDRAGLGEFLRDRGISTIVHYPRALHQLPPFQEKFRGRSFPVAERLAAQCLSLPLCPTLDVSQIDYVCDTIGTYFKEINLRRRPESSRLLIPKSDCPRLG